MYIDDSVPQSVQIANLLQSANSNVLMSQYNNANSSKL